MRSRLRSDLGSSAQNTTPEVPNRGRAITVSITATRLRSISGPRYRPATNPMTTLGSAATISTVGLILARILGWTNCEVYSAPNTARGMANIKA